MPLTAIPDASIKQPNLMLRNVRGSPAESVTDNQINKEEFMAGKKAGAKKVAAAKAPMTKSAMLDQIAQNTGLTRKQVSAVFDELSTLIESHLKKGSAGQFTFPGL